MQVSGMLRFAVFGLACAVILYACLAPVEALPRVGGGDKAQHAAAWAALTGFGILLWPARPWRVAAFTLAFGLAIEALQATMGAGRTGDARDLAADALGVAAALGTLTLLRRRRRNGA